MPYGSDGSLLHGPLSGGIQSPFTAKRITYGHKRRENLWFFFMVHKAYEIILLTYELLPTVGCCLRFLKVSDSCACIFRQRQLERVAMLLLLS